MKHLKKGYIFNGKPVKNTQIDTDDMSQRMTDAADAKSTRPRLLIKRDEEEDLF
tara:strand:+ start:9705 stop:9866 length:162 start_codon:yes stop_codon:yes gene_type:complete